MMRMVKMVMSECGGHKSIVKMSECGGGGGAHRRTEHRTGHDRPMVMIMSTCRHFAEIISCGSSDRR